jgi:ERF superfamily
MQTSESINELATALSKAQGEITGALKDSANPFFKSKYADLASCWDACRAALSKNGLAVTQFPTTEATATYLTTSLLHSSGQWMRSSLLVQPKDDSPQAMGSALTYARRYALTAIVGVAQVDDDGNAASGRNVTEIHSPKGEMGKQIPIDKAMETATAMRGILELDIEERLKSLKVLDKHDVLNKDPDLYVAASDQMSAKEKAAWKTYVSMAVKAEKEDRIASGRKF